MRTNASLGITIAVLSILILTLALPYSWGGASNRLGTVLAIVGIASVTSKKSNRPMKLRFRDALFLQDKLRTEEEGRIKVLLNDDSIWTLRGAGDMEFIESGQPRCTADRADSKQATKPKPRRKIAQKVAKKLAQKIGKRKPRQKIARLLSGKLRVTSSPLADAKAVTEVRTPNTSACMRGTDFILSYEDGVSEVTVLEGEVSVQNLDVAASGVQTVTSNSRSIVSGKAAATPAVKVSAAALQSLTQDVTVTEQVPSEVDAVEETGPPRGETASASEATEAETGTVSVGEAATEEAPSSEAVEDTAPAADSVSQTEVVTPDTSPAAEKFIRQSILEFTVEFTVRRGSTP